KAPPMPFVRCGEVPPPIRVESNGFQGTCVMHRLLQATAAVALVGSSALLSGAAPAADLARPAAPLPVAAPIGGHWSGTYIGGFAGGHWSKDRWQSDETAPANSAAFGPQDLHVDGFTGGFVSGANLQLGSWAFGVETDIRALTGNDNFDNLRPPFPGASSDAIETKMRWNGDARFRFGYDMSGPWGAWMPFVAGGAAYARTKTTLTDVTNPAPFPQQASVEQNRIGYTIGAGVDWMFA